MTSDERSSDTFFDGHWLREATNSESFFDKTQMQGIYSLCYTLRLKSKSPLKEEQVKLALGHLYRKCSSLNFCFGSRDGIKWIRRVTCPDIDFQVIKNQGPEEVRKCLLCYKFKRLTGPLFCARLVQNPKETVGVPDDLEPRLPHTSYILFGLHHGIGDGKTISCIMGFFMGLLNDVISGKTVSKDPLGEIVGTEYIEEEVEKRREILRRNPAKKTTMSQEIHNFESNVAFIKTGFPEPMEKKETAIEEYVFDRKTTGKFIQRCREENVTVNSGFCAAASVALTDLLVENGIKQNSYTVKTSTAVNLRRYSKTNISNGLGIHFGIPLAVTSQVPGNLHNQYWEYARSFHKQISHSLENGETLLKQAYLTLPSKEMSVSYLDEEKHTYLDFAISNMGDMTSTVTEVGKEVRATHFYRSLSIDKVNACPISILCHTFRGQFTMSISYNTGVVGTDVIKRFCRQIVKRMQSVQE